jgi:salicylate hydroxylase
MRRSRPNARWTKRLLDASPTRGGAARSRPVLIAGAGIGGLTAALALARKGFEVTVYEQAARLEETGAGIQLSPNAVHVLRVLGVDEAIAPLGVMPEEIRVMSARGREITRLPLGRTAEERYGAPYRVVHRADLQAVLLAAVRQEPEIGLHLGTSLQDFAVHANGVTAQIVVQKTVRDAQGIALIGADGLWSTARRRLGDPRPPRFARRTAWRATVSADRIASPFREAATWLWLGPDSHLVHYPVAAGSHVNIVAIVRDDWDGAEWSAAGTRGELLRRFAAWDTAARDLLAAPDAWLKWALHDRRPLPRWGDGAVTLLGDAAHPMLPFLAQGAAMAIEDAYVLAEQLAARPEDAPAALRAYEQARRRRTARVQRAAAWNDRLYHLKAPFAFARNLALRLIGGQNLRRRYDWLYDWKP